VAAAPQAPPYGPKATRLNTPLPWTQPERKEHGSSGQHGDDAHERAHQAVLEELRKGLHVARESGNEPPTRLALEDIHSEALQVNEEARAKLEEHRLPTPARLDGLRPLNPPTDEGTRREGARGGDHHCDTASLDPVVDADPNEERSGRPGRSIGCNESQHSEKEPSPPSNERPKAQGPLSGWSPPCRRHWLIPNLSEGSDAGFDVYGRRVEKAARRRPRSRRIPPVVSVFEALDPHLPGHHQRLLRAVGDEVMEPCRARSDLGAGPLRAHSPILKDDEPIDEADHRRTVGYHDDGGALGKLPDSSEDAFLGRRAER